jgi:hypothetical protein
MPPTDIQLPNGQTIRVGDHGDYPLYSAAMLQSDQSVEAEIFTYRRGATLPGGNTSTVKANKLHTNVPDAGRMPSSEEMMVFSIAVEFETSVALAALKQVMDNVYLELFIDGSKPFVESIVKHHPAGSGIWGFSNEDAAYSYGNGEPHPAANRQLAVPHLIPPDSTYSVTLSEPGGALTAGSADILTRVIFRGLRRRKVQ